VKAVWIPLLVIIIFLRQRKVQHKEIVGTMVETAGLPLYSKLFLREFITIK
jgi:hypothetical protein